MIAVDGFMLVLVSFEPAHVSCTRRTTPEKFYIEVCDDGSVDVLAIDRVSTDMTRTGKQRFGGFAVHAHIVE